MKNKNIGFVSSVTLLALFTLTPLFAYTTINSQLELGEKNNDVTNLQSFFKDNSSIYPEGLVTGYYGGLTKNAVIRFQAQNNLDQVGRVGPLTRDKINNLISSGGWTMADVSGPAFYNVIKSQTSSSATFTFTTDERTSVRVAYNTSSQMFNEGDIYSNGFGPIGGYSVSDTSGMSTSHSVTVPNLNSNTTYYYTVIATDAAGNVSVLGPNNTFKTN